MENRKRNGCGYILALGIIVFYSGVSAQSISPRLDSLRAYCTMPVDLPDGATDNQLPTAKKNKCINLAVTQVEYDFPAYVRYDTVTMKTTTEGAGLNTDFRDLRFVFRMTAETTLVGQDTVIKPIRTPIPKRLPDTLRWLRTDSKADVQDNEVLEEPTAWFVEGQRLFIQPRWSDPDSGLFLISYYAIDSTKTDDTATFRLQRHYLPRVVEYARGLMYMTIGKPADAAMWFSMYAVEVNKALPSTRAVSYQEVTSK